MVEHQHHAGPGLVQALVQLPSLWRPGATGRHLALAGLWRDPDVRRIVRLMGPAVVGLAAMNVNVFVNTQFASKLGDGPVASLNFAFRLFYLPIGLFGVSIGDRGAAGRSRATPRRRISTSMRRTVADALRLMLMLNVPADRRTHRARATRSCRSLLERGNFGPADTAATAAALMCYAPGLLGYAVVKVACAHVLRAARQPHARHRQRALGRREPRR